MDRRERNSNQEMKRVFVHKQTSTEIDLLRLVKVIQRLALFFHQQSQNKWKIKDKRSQTNITSMLNI